MIRKVITKLEDTLAFTAIIYLKIVILIIFTHKIEWFNILICLLSL